MTSTSACLISCGILVFLLRSFLEPALAFVHSPLAVERSQKKFGLHSLRVLSPRDSSYDEAEDAARLYQALAAEEGRRRKEVGKNTNGKSFESGKGFGGGFAGRKRGGRATRRYRRSIERTANGTPESQHPQREQSKNDDDLEGRMRLKLKGLEEELKRSEGGIARDETKKHIIAKKDRKRVEADVNRLKLQLAEARREAQEKRERAEDAELRVIKLLDNSSSSASLPGPVSASPTERKPNAVDSVRVETAAQIESLHAQNRQKLGNYERAAAMDRQVLRNRAWSLETELTKQKMVLETAQREAREAKTQAEKLEARIVELVEKGDVRITDLARDVEDAAQLLAKTRKRSAGRLMAMREIFRTRLRKQNKVAEERIKAVQAEMDAKLQTVQRLADEELLVIRQKAAEAVVGAKLDKERTVDSEREQLEAYKTLMVERLEREKETAARRIQEVEEELAIRLEHFRATSEMEKKALREEGRGKVAEVQAGLVLKKRRLLDEMDRKEGEFMIRGVSAKRENADTDTLVPKNGGERTSIRHLARLASRSIARIVHFG